MDTNHFLTTISTLSDLDLAILLSLLAHEHPLISTPDDHLDSLAQQLAQIVSQRFSLSYLILDFSCFSTGNSTNDADDAGDLADFIARCRGNGNGYSDYDDELDPLSQSRTKRHSTTSDITPTLAKNEPDEQHENNSTSHKHTVIPNVLIAKHVNRAPAHLQAQLIELLEKHRLIVGPHRINSQNSRDHAGNDLIDETDVSDNYTTPASLSPPSTFLFVPVIGSSTVNVRMTPHLNDRIFISHYHDPRDEVLDIGDRRLSRSRSSSSDNSDTEPRPAPDTTTISWAQSRSTPSHTATATATATAKPSNTHTPKHKPPTTPRSNHIQKAVIDDLRALGSKVAVTAEVRRYTQDIVTYLRIERGVDGGVSPRATRQIIVLTKYLAVLHGLEFVTPALVALAVRKIYAHRIVIATPARERSILYGSDITAVARWLQDVTPESVIEEVLKKVPCPR